ncbi:SorB family sulfite dehydrogenase c-type cytochrome subunit [Candidatus Nitrotoga sp. M5]|uniref:SorB family sulfite dehydrogenase c-type cytochrome subunit n=1 Tax=Candidatus Nitrotoga sp. M5 TaxID=2890409 RepID=UPI001EF74471|nr:c-type cytochrome [Candidatus Nitrotoga sp. M5]CAH1387327.1 Sulfite:cytochrome c oxidoreductase, subunit B [Candidatus Nitrotoga sp. M5]
MRDIFVRIVLAVSTLAPYSAIALDIQLPPETAVFKPNELPGYILAQRNCTICHSVHYIQSQPPSSPRGYWEATVKKMKVTFGAKFADEDIPVIVDYLAKTYGAERSVGTTKPNTADKPAIVALTATSAPADAKALLAANNCMACHAIDKKIVGPAFRDVAAKYASNTKAAALVARNIRDGGSGKWGAVLMPSFRQLSEAEADILAHYVLSQGDL